MCQSAGTVYQSSGHVSWGVPCVSLWGLCISLVAM